jgi:hypothetical protein
VYSPPPPKSPETRNSPCPAASWLFIELVRHRLSKATRRRSGRQAASCISFFHRSFSRILSTPFNQPCLLHSRRQRLIQSPQRIQRTSWLESHLWRTPNWREGSYATIGSNDGIPFVGCPTNNCYLQAPLESRLASASSVVYHRE